MALEKFGKMIGNLASTTAKKAGEQVQITKLGIDRAAIDRQMEGIYAAMGRYCYNLIKEGRELPEELLEYCRDIDTLIEQQKQLDDQITAHKTERDAAEYTVAADFRDLKGTPVKEDYVEAVIIEDIEEVAEIVEEAAKADE